MALTARTAQKHIEHSLAGVSELEALSILNQAGRYLVGMRNWRWLRGAKKLLDITSGDEFVNLPADCKRVEAIEQTNSLVGTFSFVSLKEFLNYKTSTITISPISYWGTIVWARDTYSVSGDEKPGAPSMRIELYPIPTTTGVGAFTLYYDRGWVELEEDNQELTLPPFMELLYLAIARMIALGYEEEATADVNQRLASLHRGPLWDVAIREDLAAQPSIGPLSGGIASRGTALYRWSGASING